MTDGGLIPRLLVCHTRAGPIPVRTAAGPDGLLATLTSIPPVDGELTADVRDRLLTALRLTADDLDPRLPIRTSFTGNAHPIVAVRRDALERLDQDQQALTELMADQGWHATVTVVHRIGPAEFLARNPFPPGGVREDPATGAAAAALGGYLRHLGEVRPPARVVIHQGAQIGRPSLLLVDVPAAGGIEVSGAAARIPHDATASGDPVPQR